MQIIPAVDIMDGKCVRLYQGREDRQTVYNSEPAAAAARWQREGAEYLHVVDLDGAFHGEPQNLHSLRTILEGVTIPVEFGGGLREIDTVKRVMGMGVDRVILGTSAIEGLDFLRSAVELFGKQVFVGLDVKGGCLRTGGWRKRSVKRPVEMLAEIQDSGAGGVIYTDIRADGTLTGPDFEAVGEILQHSQLPVIASGGVASLKHIRRLRELQEGKLYGVIIGRALYTGDIKLEEAIAAAAGNNVPE